MRGAALLLLVACEREPLDVCPAVVAGELAVNELAAGWLELRSTSDAPLALAGLRLHERRLDGSDGRDLLVRSETVVESGGLLVLSTPLYPGGVLDVWACHEHVDRASWTALPAPAALARSGDGFCLAAPTPGAENLSCP